MQVGDTPDLFSVFPQYIDRHMAACFLGRQEKVFVITVVTSVVVGKSICPFGFTVPAISTP